MLDNAFCGLKDKPVPTKTLFDQKAVYKEIAIVKKVVKTGPKDTDYVLDDEVVTLSECPLQDYINSFRDDVGILNVLKKVRQSGDISLLNQRSRADIDIDSGNLEKVVDITGMPNSYEKAVEAVRAGDAAFDKLDPSLKEGKSYTEVANLDDSAIQAYIDKAIAAKFAAPEIKEKEGDK